MSSIPTLTAGGEQKLLYINESIKQETLDSGRVIYYRRITQLGRKFILGLFDMAA